MPAIRSRTPHTPHSTSSSSTVRRAATRPRARSDSLGRAGRSACATSAAPSRGLRARTTRPCRTSPGRVVAFTDDDVIVDREWVAALAGPFADPSVACVTGLILPAELETAAQIRIEQAGGFARGFERRAVSLHNRAGRPAVPVHRRDGWDRAPTWPSVPNWLRQGRRLRRRDRRRDDRPRRGRPARLPARHPRRSDARLRAERDRASPTPPRTRTSCGGRRSATASGSARTSPPPHGVEPAVLARMARRCVTRAAPPDRARLSEEHRDPRRLSARAGVAGAARRAHRADRVRAQPGERTRMTPTAGDLRAASTSRPGACRCSAAGIVLVANAAITAGVGIRLLAGRSPALPGRRSSARTPRRSRR